MDCARSVDMGHETTEDVNMGTNTHTHAREDFQACGGEPANREGVLEIRFKGLEFGDGVGGQSVRRKMVRTGSGC